MQLRVQVIKPGVWTAVVKVVGVVLVFISLALKRDGEIGALDIASFDEADEPFYSVPKIKGQDEQFEHLTRVDAFVAKVGISELHPLAHEDEA